MTEGAKRTATRDDRGVSTTLNYVLGLAIALILVTGLLLAGGTFVENQRDQSIETELEVLAEQVSSDVEMADRLVETTSDNESVQVGRDLPARVAGSTYEVRFDGGTDPQVVVRTTDPEIAVRVPVKTSTPIESSSVSGGTIAVNYTASDELALEDEST
ncbi:hypothetical protein SAMN05216388_1006128 [Halorientalis persicus]|jgi:hypothetical protein|uniref:Secreted glycoprotein n=1 Tax=Halorientalis persicus TaxID=1367881 RepID=A0A1H8KNV5_9EURY|nr:hypothetical protein [Halorientalis persicus]SEN94640.1 hypothetical protein SAMN05216388_1006128 [Halorientalis persicus]